MKLKKSNDCWHIAMWRFKGHSMVVLNCGIPTIMLELTLISFCNIINQITLHLKESRTRDLQLIFYILNLYTMQQLAFSPGSRDGGYVCACMWALRLLLKIFICFLTFHRKLEKSHFLMFSMIFPLFLVSPTDAQKDSGCVCARLPSLPPLWKPCLPSCAESDLSNASEHTETPPSTVGSRVLGTFHAFCDVFAVKVTLWGRQVVESLMELQAGLPPKLPRAETKGLARWAGALHHQAQVWMCPGSCWRTLGSGDGPSLQQTLLPWSHSVLRGGRAQLHLCAALRACMAVAAWMRGSTASWDS